MPGNSNSEEKTLIRRRRSIRLYGWIAREIHAQEERDYDR